MSLRSADRQQPVPNIRTVCRAVRIQSDTFDAESRRRRFIKGSVYGFYWHFFEKSKTCYGQEKKINNVRRVGNNTEYHTFLSGKSLKNTRVDYILYTNDFSTPILMWKQIICNLIAMFHSIRYFTKRRMRKTIILFFFLLQ